MMEVICAPRVDVNEEKVTVVSLGFPEGAQVKAGDEVAVIETFKASTALESPLDGFVRQVFVEEGEEVACGTPMLLITSAKDGAYNFDMSDFVESDEEGNDRIPAEAAKQSSSSETFRITAKAKRFADENNIDLELVPTPEGGVLRLGDVEAFQQRQKVHSNVPSAPFVKRPMTAVEKGVVETLSWAKLHAVPAYLERYVDLAAMESYADKLQKELGLLASPKLHILAYEFVQLIKRFPEFNATCVDNAMLLYQEINLGVTMTAGENLYLPVLRQCDQWDMCEFINELNALQRRLIKNDVTSQDLSGATIGITSLANEQVHKHIPVLPPFVGLMLAHSSPIPQGDSKSALTCLGITYDHRVYTGAKVAKLLKALQTKLEKL